MTIQVTEEVDRVDRFLADYFDKPRSWAKYQISEKHILMNGKVLKAAQSLKEGDEILIQALSDPSSEDREVDPSLFDAIEVCFEDESVLVIRKPAGLVVHPGVKQSSGTVIDFLRSHVPSLPTIGDEDRPGIVHRLDRETEGLMVIAKTNEAYTHLVDQFKERRIEKKYYAMAYGNIEEDQLVIDSPIGRHSRFRIMFSVEHALDHTKKDAYTELMVIKRYGTKTLVSLSPRTGRTHQLRVHMFHIGHPILGDPLYGPKKGKFLGQQLQSYYLSFTHPVSGEQLSFEDDLSSRLSQI